MQQTQFAMLAGGHEKHFDFLPGGELVSKRSGLREAYFYVWLHRLAGRPLIHAASIETFLEELRCRKKPVATGGTALSPTASEVQDEAVAAAQKATEQPPPVKRPSDDALWRTLLVPQSSKTKDDFDHFSLEYCRQARALLAWLPVCVGTVEQVYAPQSSSWVGGSTAAETNCQQGTATGPCATGAPSTARPKGHILLENLLHGMREPAVLDTKLGTKYYGEEVSAAKRERAERYAQQRGTSQVGMAFSGYCYWSSSENTVVSVSGGSRAPADFMHPKTLQDFSELFQSFLMIQGDVDTAVCLGKIFASELSELLRLLRSAAEKPLAGLFGTSVLLIYDAAGKRVTNAACGANPAGDDNGVIGVQQQRPAEVDVGCDVKNVVCVKQQAKQKLPVTTQRTVETLVKGEKPNTARGAEEPAWRLEDKQEREEAADNFLRSAFGGNLSSGRRLRGDDGVAGECVETENGRLLRMNGNVKAAHFPVGDFGNIHGGGSCCRETPSNEVHTEQFTGFHVKVRLVDFAHVIVLPQQVDGGFIFGLENFRAALHLATQALESSKSPQLNASH